MEMEQTILPAYTNFKMKNTTSWHFINRS